MSPSASEMKHYKSVEIAERVFDTIKTYISPAILWGYLLRYHSDYVLERVNKALGRLDDDKQLLKDLAKEKL